MFSGSSCAPPKVGTAHPASSMTFHAFRSWGGRRPAPAGKSCGLRNVEPCAAVTWWVGVSSRLRSWLFFHPRVQRIGIALGGANRGEVMTHPSGKRGTGDRPNFCHQAQRRETCFALQVIAPSALMNNRGIGAEAPRPFIAPRRRCYWYCCVRNSDQAPRPAALRATMAVQRGLRPR